MSYATFKTSWNTVQPSRQHTPQKPQDKTPFGIRRARERAMMPGGHLATSLALGGVAYFSTGSVETAAGCFAGGFLIDVDHYGDYLIFEKQWRRPGPVSFLRYYFAHRPKKIVLPLHSAELMTVLFLVILAHPRPLLVGYWFGALMHLVFDILVNGDCVLKNAFLFYIFTYRASCGFAAERLLDIDDNATAGTAPIREFFRWRPVEDLGVKSPTPEEKSVEVEVTVDGQV